MAGETFELRFRNNEDTYLSIDEPIDFASVDFQLSQKDKGYGRDVSFNGGETQFEFVKYRNHYLDKLLSYNNTYGFESIVELIITCGTITTIIGELDFATAITDDFEYFKCKVIQQSSRQVVKRRKGIKVDLLSDKDIDGNYIAPLVPQNLVTVAKPIFESSRWEQGDDVSGELVHSYGDGRTNYRILTREIVDSTIDSTLVPNDDGSADGTIFLSAVNELRSVAINISEFYVQVNLYNRSGGGNGSGYFGLRWGTDWWTAAVNEQKLQGSSFSFSVGGQSHEYTSSFIYTIPVLLPNEKVWIYHSVYVDHSGSRYSSVNITQRKMNIDITSETLASNSVVYSFRLIDVMRQVVKSISGLDITAPRFDTAGEFYNNRLVNGNFLRKITAIYDAENKLVNKAFLISLEDLEKSIIEFNADWEINSDGDIFFGTEDDFYTNNILMEFPNTQFSSFNKTFNPKFQINQFDYGYKTYQSLKENEELFSSDVINGDSKWVLKNKSVENKKEIKIEWIRDSFTIETNRRKAIEITTDTSSQEDDSLFVIDSKNTEMSLVTDSDTCSYQYNGATEYLNLQSSGAVAKNFNLLPFNVGDAFKIISPTSINIGNYIVRSINTSKLELDRQNDDAISGAISTTYNWGAIIKTYVFTHYYSNKILRLTRTSGTQFTETYIEGGIITITSSSINKGKYEIFDVNNIAGNVYLDLKRIDDDIITGITTSFQYTINPSINPFTSYTSENITNIKNLSSGTRFSNIRYSIRRNIENYWKKYLATCNMYNKTQDITNTWYKNNKYFSATYAGLTLIESDPIVTEFTTPNLTPFIYNDVVFANVEFADYIALQNRLRSVRGYIKTYDNNGLEIKLYPMSMKYENLSKELTMKAEEKYN